jgi:hypothetical protein
MSWSRISLSEVIYITQNLIKNTVVVAIWKFPTMEFSLPGENFE